MSIHHGRERLTGEHFVLIQCDHPDHHDPAVITGKDLIAASSRSAQRGWTTVHDREKKTVRHYCPVCWSPFSDGRVPDVEFEDEEDL